MRENINQEQRFHKANVIFNKCGCCWGCYPLTNFKRQDVWGYVGHTTLLKIPSRQLIIDNWKSSIHPLSIYYVCFAGSRGSRAYISWVWGTSWTGHRKILHPSIYSSQLLCLESQVLQNHGHWKYFFLYVVKPLTARSTSTYLANRVFKSGDSGDFPVLAQQ